MERNQGDVIVLRIFPGLERIILHTEKGEINITAGTTLILLMSNSQPILLPFQIKLRNKTGIDPLLVSSAEILCWQDPLKATLCTQDYSHDVS